MATGGSQHRVDGLTHYQRNKQRYRDKADKRKVEIREFIRNDKASQGCADCGISDWRVLDYDHVGDDKVINIAQIATRGWSITRLKSEILKCEVVCANCHRIRTITRLAGIA